MEFVREICAALGADALRLRYTIVSGKGAYFQNVYRLAAFSETEIVVRGRHDATVVPRAVAAVEAAVAIALLDAVLYGEREQRS